MANYRSKSRLDELNAIAENFAYYGPAAAEALSGDMRQIPFTLREVDMSDIRVKSGRF